LPFGVGISLHGYDETVADFVSGQSTLSYLNSTVAGGVPVGGLANAVNTRSGNPPGSLDVSEVTRLGGRIVEIFQGISLTPATGDGSLDLGIAGGSIASGDVHARIVFAILGAGSTLLRIDSAYPGDAIVLAGGQIAQATGTSILLGPGVVVPEPGTALLVGLGLAALARPSARSARRR
jgi:hypothetical protein